MQVGTGGMDSKVNAATWALDRGVNVVICNGTQEKAIKMIIGGRKVGTFFTETASGGPTPVETLAENGKVFSFCTQKCTKKELLSLYSFLVCLPNVYISPLPTIQKVLFLSAILFAFSFFCIKMNG